MEDAPDPRCKAGCPGSFQRASYINVAYEVHSAARFISITGRETLRALIGTLGCDFHFGTVARK